MMARHRVEHLMTTTKVIENPVAPARAKGDDLRADSVTKKVEDASGPHYGMTWLPGRGARAPLVLGTLLDAPPPPLSHSLSLTRSL